MAHYYVVTLPIGEPVNLKSSLALNALFGGAGVGKGEAMFPCIEHTTNVDLSINPRQILLMRKVML